MFDYLATVIIYIFTFFKIILVDEMFSLTCVLLVAPSSRSYNTVFDSSFVPVFHY